MLIFGICIDVDDFTHTATVVPITEYFQGYFVAKITLLKRIISLNLILMDNLRRLMGLVISML